MARNFPGATANYVDRGATSDAALDIGATDSLIWECWLSAAADSTARNLCMKKTSTAAANPGWATNIGTPNVLVARVSSGTSVSAPSTSALTANLWYHYAAVIRRGSTNTIVQYLNGAIQGTPASISTVGSPSNAVRFRVGADNSATPGGFWSGNVANMRVWKKAGADWTTDEINSILAQRFSSKAFANLNYLSLEWPLFGVSSPEPDFGAGVLPGTVTGTTRSNHPPSISAVWMSQYPWAIFPLGATDHPLSADPGTYAITGSVAGTLADRLLAALTTSYAITGFVTGLSHGFFISADGGTYSIAGTALTALADRMLAATAGSYVVTGAAATLLSDRLLGASPGSYAIAGQVSGLTADRLLGALAGSYAVSGSPTTLLRDLLMAANPGAYNLSGAPATALADRLLSLDPTTYSITGLDATFVYFHGGEFTLVADPGNYALTGQIATFLADRLLNADSGVYLVSGPDSALLVGRLLDANPGSYVLSGSDASSVTERMLIANTGAYAIIGDPTTLLWMVPGPGVAGTDPYGTIYTDTHNFFIKEGQGFIIKL